MGVLTNKELLDIIEEIVIKGSKPGIQSIFNQADIKIDVTDQVARNLIGKVGVRIIFGSDVADEVLMRKK